MSPQLIPSIQSWILLAVLTSLCSRIPAEAFAHWISSHSSHEPKVVRPFDYTKLATSVGAVLAGATILTLSFNTLKPALYSRNLWSAISLILILLFTSGHMFNHIRRVPYVANDGKGGIAYVAGGFSNQYGLETQVVAIACMSCVIHTYEFGG